MLVVVPTALAAAPLAVAAVAFAEVPLGEVPLAFPPIPAAVLASLPPLVATVLVFCAGTALAAPVGLAP